VISDKVANSSAQIWVNSGKQHMVNKTRTLSSFNDTAQTHNIIFSLRDYVLLNDPHNHHNRFTALFQDHPDEPVPEENFWTLWCKGRLTD